MLRIGFVDHHLNNFHANKFLALLHGPLADLDARVSAAWESDPTGEDWCAAKGVRRCDSAEEVASACDAIIVLAPDNIEAHPHLCSLVFPSGKPAVVDKFLATNPADARGIVELAQRFNVTLFSSSSLRFAVEVEAALEDAGAVSEAFARGMGEWDGYGVHTLAMVLAGMGHDVTRLIDTGTASSACVTLEYRDGRRATVEVRAAENMWEALPWQFGYRAGERYLTGTVADFDGFYANLMRRAVQFFRTGETPVSTDEMLRVVAILESAGRSRDAGGKWLELIP
jgi:predicted dehydrogenase